MSAVLATERFEAAYGEAPVLRPPSSFQSGRHDSGASRLLSDQLDERTDDAVELVMQGAILTDVT